MHVFLYAILGAIVAVLPVAVNAQPQPKVGVVLMHGKSGSPARLVAPLAAALEQNGFLVANLEMPWSGGRNYDVDVGAAERQVQEAIDGLKGKGAEKLFVAGHSQGGVFALHMGSRVAVHGVVAIAPGGSTGSPLYREKLGESLEQARRYVAEGKGAEKQRLMDYEGSHGTYSIVAPPAAYVSWFDPDGAMNQVRASKALPRSIPVLYVAPTGDYPGLRRTKQMMFGALPSNPSTRLYEPNADHLQAPAAASDEVMRWMREVAAAPKP